MFEQYAIKCLSLSDQDPPFHVFAPTRRTPKKHSGRYPVQFRYQPPSAGLTHPPELLNLHPRTITQWDETDSEPLSDKNFYVPTIVNRAFFDAFFIHCQTSNGAVLWVLQMTVSTDHDGEEEGFSIVKKIAAKVEADLGRTVQIKYSLVVPYNIDDNVPTYKVKWRMAKRRPVGEVFVQFLGT